jgi:hypothetical protein
LQFSGQPCEFNPPRRFSEFEALRTALVEAGFPRARAAKLPTKLVFFASVAKRNVALPTLLNFLLASIGDRLMVETTAAPLRDFLGPKILSLGASPADAAIRLFGGASCPGGDAAFARRLEEAEVADRALAENLQREEGELAAGEVYKTAGGRVWIPQRGWFFEQGNDTLLSQPPCTGNVAGPGLPAEEGPGGAYQRINDAQLAAGLNASLQDGAATRGDESNAGPQLGHTTALRL